MGFSRQGYWSGLPFPSPGDLADPGIGPRDLFMSPALAGRFFNTDAPGDPTPITYCEESCALFILHKHTEVHLWGKHSHRRLLGQRAPAHAVWLGRATVPAPWLCRMQFPYTHPSNGCSQSCFSAGLSTIQDTTTLCTVRPSQEKEAFFIAISLFYDWVDDLMFRCQWRCPSMNCLQIQGGPTATGQAPCVLYVTRAQLCTQPEEACSETAGLRIRTILERKSSAMARVSREGFTSRRPLHPGFFPGRDRQTGKDLARIKVPGRSEDTADSGVCLFYWFLNYFYWSLVALQCCVSFCCTAK